MLAKMSAEQLFSMWVLIIIGSLLFTYLLLRLGLSALASVDTLFTFRIEGRFKFVMFGESLHKILYKQPGYHLRGGPRNTTGSYTDISAYDLIEFKHGVGGGEEMSYFDHVLEFFFGVVFIGLPPYKIKVYEFVWDREPRPTDPHDGKHKITKVETGSKDGGFSYIHRSDETKVLYMRHVYLLVVLSVELTEQVTIDVWGTMTIQAKNIYKPVILLDGKWFGHTKDGAAGGIQDYCRNKSLADFRNAEKGKMGSDIEKAVLASSIGPTSATETTGMEILAFNFGGWQLTAASSAVEKAARDVAVAESQLKAETSRANAKAVHIRTEGQAQVEINTANAGLVKDNLGATVVLAAQALGGAIVAAATGSNPSASSQTNRKKKRKEKDGEESEETEE